MSIYEAGIYDWAAEQRSIIDMMTPYPPPRFVIPGMHVGCIAFVALTKSTLECFFSSSCVNDMTSLISNLNVSSRPPPLELEKLSRFTVKDTIESMADVYFVQALKTTTNFSGYYSSCNPIECTYTYLDYDSIINIIKQIIGYYGGLSIFLQKVALILITVINKIQCYMRKRRARVDGVPTQLRKISKRILHKLCSNFDVFVCRK